MLRPGFNAIHSHYHGPQVPDDGQMLLGDMVTYYLVETDPAHQAEGA